MAVDSGSTGDAMPTTAGNAGNSMLKVISITFGLFVLMLLAQLVSPIIGCKLLASVTPSCGDPAAVEGASKAAAAPKGPPVYLPIDPPIVVSLQDNGSIRFLQVAIELMARDEKALAEVDKLMPIVRNNLLMLLGGQTIATLTDRDGKESLRGTALDEIRAIVRDNRGNAKPGSTLPEIEDLYFTSFVVQ